jgi:cell pole-organizing protein PopZ
MTDAKAPEPSIEEILASIRKIISDDEPEAGSGTVAEAAPVEPPEEEEEILELTEVALEPPVEETSADETERIMVMPPEPEEPPVEPSRIETFRPVQSEPAIEIDSIASPETVAAASGAFAKLSHIEPPAPHTISTSSGGGKSVEDIVRELLKPMLKSWIDQNLAGIVERLVEHELKKISRRSEDL